MTHGLAVRRQVFLVDSRYAAEIEVMPAVLERSFCREGTEADSKRKRTTLGGCWYCPVTDLVRVKAKMTGSTGTWEGAPASLNACLPNSLILSQAARAKALTILPFSLT